MATLYDFEMSSITGESMKLSDYEGHKFPKSEKQDEEGNEDIAWNVSQFLGERSGHVVEASPPSTQVCVPFTRATSPRASPSSAFPVTSSARRNPASRRRSSSSEESRAELPIPVEG